MFYLFSDVVVSLAGSSNNKMKCTYCHQLCTIIRTQNNLFQQLSIAQQPNMPNHTTRAKPCTKSFPWHQETQTKWHVLSDVRENEPEECWSSLISMRCYAQRQGTGRGKPQRDSMCSSSAQAIDRQLQQICKYWVDTLSDSTEDCSSTNPSSLIWTKW